MLALAPPESYSRLTLPFTENIVASYENPELPNLIEQAFQLRRLLFSKGVEISSVTGLNVGEVLVRIEYMCDSNEPSLDAFVAFDEKSSK